MIDERINKIRNDLKKIQKDIFKKSIKLKEGELIGMFFTPVKAVPIAKSKNGIKIGFKEYIPNSLSIIEVLCSHWYI